jgi:hypothetical protein
MERVLQEIEDARLKCRCGCGHDCNPSLKDALRSLEEKLKRKLIINSGARCAAHNKSVKGASSSLHISGLAIDVHTSGVIDQDVVISTAREVGFRGIGRGYGGRMVHLDLGPRREWEYDKNNRPIQVQRPLWVSADVGKRARIKGTTISGVIFAISSDFVTLQIMDDKTGLPTFRLVPHSGVELCKLT